MKEGYIIKYFNEFTMFCDGSDYLRVINKSDSNEVHLIWWHEDYFKHYGTIGQWKIKKLKS